MRFFKPFRAGGFIYVAMAFIAVATIARGETMTENEMTLNAESIMDRVLFYAPGWGEFGLNTCVHAPGQEPLALRIKDTPYEKGFGQHANGEMLIDLNGEFASFEAEVGVQWQGGSVGSAVFQVFVDDELKFDSGLMTEFDEARPVSVPLVGAVDLRLVVTDGGDGNACDAANWVNPSLARDPDAKGRPNTSLRVDLAPFARVITGDPKRMDGAHQSRVEPFPTGELFFDQPVAPDEDGVYKLPAIDGAAMIGLQWLERRRLRELSLEFADAGSMPLIEEIQVQQWVMAKRGGSPGGSAWQGHWQSLPGQLSVDGARLGFTIDWSGNLDARNDGILKIRWLMPVAPIKEPQPWPANNTPFVKIRSLSAWSNSSWRTVPMTLQLETPRPGQVAEIEMYNGQLIGESGAAIKCQWDLAGPLHLSVRASKPRPWKSDQTVIRVKLPDASSTATLGFGVAVDDVLSSGPVYVKDYGFYAAADADPTLAEYRQSIEGEETILTRVRQMPDQTMAQAMDKLARPDAGHGPTMLSLAADNAKFIAHRGGMIEFDDDPEYNDHIDGWAARRHSCLLEPHFGRTGQAAFVSRELETGWMPLPTITFEEDGVIYRQRTYVAPYDTAPLPEGWPRWANRQPLCVVEYTIENPTGHATPVAMRLDAYQSAESKSIVETQHGVEKMDAEQVGEEMRFSKKGQTLIAFRVEKSEGLSMIPEDGAVRLEGELAAGAVVRCSSVIPGWAIQTSEWAGLKTGDALYDRTRQYWADLMAPAMQVELPDKFVQNAIVANQTHCWLAARSDKDYRVAPWIASFIYGPLESESQSVIRGMEFLGQSDFARRSFDYFFSKYNPEGYVTTGYTLMGTGWNLWTIGEYYGLTHDEAWLSQNRIQIARAADWIAAQREKTKRMGPDEEKIPEWGLMPPGAMADWEVFSYYFCLNGYYYAGLKAAADVLAEQGWPEAERLRDSAAEFKQEILRAYHQVQAQAPVFALRDGSWVPEYPTHAYCPMPIDQMYMGEDFGRSWCYDVELGAHHLIPMGVLDPASHEARQIMEHMEDVQFLAPNMNHYSLEKAQADWFNMGGFAKVQPYYARTTEVYALQDDVKPFIRSYFNQLAAMINKEDLSLWEHFHNGAYNKTHETGYFLHQSRLMLVQERGDELWLAPFVTNNWMADGEAVRVKNAPTNFGPVSYEILSHVAEGRIEATVQLAAGSPRREAPAGIVLRVRHPEGKKMQSVTVNGKAWKDFDPEREVVRLKGGAKRKIKVVARY